LFVNAAGKDFHLQANSPCKDKGTLDVSSIVTRDFDNLLRPQGDGYDIGAYEYSSYYNPSLAQTADKSNSESDGGGDGGRGCFIATAVYETPSAKEVISLCQFRDRYLMTNNMGCALVDFYYKTSPAFAEYLKKYLWIKNIVRVLLKPVVWMAKRAVGSRGVI